MPVESFAPPASATQLLAPSRVKAPLVTLPLSLSVPPPETVIAALPLESVPEPLTSVAEPPASGTHRW